MYLPKNRGGKGCGRETGTKIQNLPNLKTLSTVKRENRESHQKDNKNKNERGYRTYKVHIFNTLLLGGPSGKVSTHKGLVFIRPKKVRFQMTLKIVPKE